MAWLFPDYEEGVFVRGATREMVSREDITANLRTVRSILYASINRSQ